MAQNGTNMRSKVVCFEITWILRAIDFCSFICALEHRITLQHAHTRGDPKGSFGVVLFAKKKKGSGLATVYGNGHGAEIGGDWQWPGGGWQQFPGFDRQWWGGKSVDWQQLWGDWKWEGSGLAVRRWYTNRKKMCVVFV